MFIITCRFIELLFNFITYSHAICGPFYMYWFMPLFTHAGLLHTCEATICFKSAWSDFRIPWAFTASNRYVQWHLAWVVDPPTILLFWNILTSGTHLRSKSQCRQSLLPVSCDIQPLSGSHFMPHVMIMWPSLQRNACELWLEDNREAWLRTNCVHTRMASELSHVRKFHMTLTNPEVMAHTGPITCFL